MPTARAATASVLEAADERQRRYATAEGKSTGLELAIWRRVVQEHQSTLALTSTVGVGTTVHIVLPVA